MVLTKIDIKEVQALTVYNGKLLYGLGSPTNGRVSCFEAGRNVAYDDDLGRAWRHLVAVRERNQLKLYVDGELCATSSTFNPADYDISNDKPLLIGLGSRNCFTGAMADLCVYRGALNLQQIQKLVK